jgi:hypothetical protein
MADGMASSTTAACEDSNGYATDREEHDQRYRCDAASSELMASSLFDERAGHRMRSGLGLRPKGGGHRSPRKPGG